MKMESDDELVENIARRAFEARTGAAKACGMRVFSWDERTLSMKDAERAAARAALQVVKDAGWKPPSKSADDIFLELRDHGLTDSKQSASGYRVK